MKFIIEDDFGNHVFEEHEFESFEDGWDFLYCKFPVIENADGTRNEQEDELDSHYVIPK